MGTKAVGAAASTLGLNETAEKGLALPQGEQRKNGRYFADKRYHGRIMNVDRKSIYSKSDTLTTVDTFYSSESDEDPYFQESERSSRRTSLSDAQASLSYASADDSDYSSGGEVEQYLHNVARSPRPVSLSDARIALSYVKGKMKQQIEKDYVRDGQCKALSAWEPHRSSSKSYSSFNRPERSVMRGKMELVEKDDKQTFNIYKSEVDFVEHPLSITMIEDTPAVKVTAKSKGDTRRHPQPSSAISVRSGEVMFPSLPPARPPPLQLHTSASRKHSSVGQHSSLPRSNFKDDDVSHATDGAVFVDLESSSDSCDLLNYEV